MDGLGGLRPDLRGGEVRRTDSPQPECDGDRSKGPERGTSVRRSHKWRVKVTKNFTTETNVLKTRTCVWDVVDQGTSSVLIGDENSFFYGLIVLVGQFGYVKRVKTPRKRVG